MSDSRNTALAALACCLLGAASCASAGPPVRLPPSTRSAGRRRRGSRCRTASASPRICSCREEGSPASASPCSSSTCPYRKVEDRGRNHALYSYFVRRGYAVARVDIRGTGSSEGRLVAHEYSEQEQRDAETVIDWLSKQPFSSGRVGMFGISWGGFNSIHLAMRRPPALGAIVAVMATDDLFQDDVHYIDGQLCVDTYEIAQDLENSLPAAPDFAIDEAYFRDRFDTTPWLLVFKRQQRDGPFWNRSSLSERYDSIQVPTFVIGGWYDQYPDSLMRMVQHLESPLKAIIGPWAHSFPHDGYPKPLIEWRHEAVRWFDHWLKGRDTGILRRAALRSVRARLAPARSEPGGDLRAVALRGGLAARARSRGGPVSAARPYAGCRRSGAGDACAAIRPDRGRGERAVVG